MPRPANRVFKVCGKEIQKKCGSPKQNRSCASDIGKKCFKREMKK